jgi:hypothetical protein
MGKDARKLMALTLLNQTIRDMLANTRSEITDANNIYDALVSDLQANDFLLGPRAVVTSVGATSGVPAVRALTLTRDGITFTVSWLAAQTIRVKR